MLKIHQLFLRTYISIFLAILITLSVVTYFWSKDIYIDQIEKTLIQNIDTLSIVFKNKNDMENISDIVKELHEKLNLRITIIDENGVVIAESDEKLSKIKNHLNRKEIIEARIKNIGKDTRESETLEKELLYIAKKIIISDKIYYIRMADYISNITDNFMKLTFKIFLFMTFFLIVTFLATYLISIKIKKETDNILFFLTQLSDKKSSLLLNSNYTYEFHKITKLLNKVALKLYKREKQKAKQNVKLKIIISGYSETILNDEQMPQAMKTKFLKKIYSNSNKMSHIIDKLRLTLKLEEGKQELILVSCSMKKIIESCVSDLKDKYKNREILIQGNDVTLKVDETLISMAISNLIENALKYSEDEIIVNISNNSITVVDKGIGIEEKELEKINKKFYRVSNNGWNNSLGLGLFIVQSVLSLHNFSLQIDSEFKKGSQFSINY